MMMIPHELDEGRGLVFQSAGNRFLSRFTRYELDTGELAERVDDYAFAIVATKEHLLRV